jgi:hypothetical protein
MIAVDGPRAFVLVPHVKPHGDQLVTVSLRTLEVTRKLRLPRKVAFRQMVFDQTRSQLLLVGNEDKDHVVVAATVSVKNASVSPLRILRRSSRGAFRVFSVGQSTDGRLVVVSYHGVNTTGADTFGLPSWKRCSSRAEFAGCLLTIHGEVALSGQTIVATTGTPPGVVSYRGGWQIGSVQLRPSNAHVTALAVSSNGRFAWVPGACDAPGGIWVVDLRSRRVTQYYPGFVAALSLVTPCGYTLDLSADGRWAVTTETSLPVPDPGRAGAIWVFPTNHRDAPPVHVPMDVDPVAAVIVGEG